MVIIVNKLNNLHYIYSLKSKMYTVVLEKLMKINTSNIRNTAT